MFFLDPIFLTCILIVVTICAYALILRKLRQKSISKSRIEHPLALAEPKASASPEAPETTQVPLTKLEPTPSPEAPAITEEGPPPAPSIIPTAKVAPTPAPSPTPKEPAKIEGKKKPRKSEIKSEESVVSSKIEDLRKHAFMAGREAALKAGWTPFTKMTKKQKQAFQEAYNLSLIHI